MFFFISMQAAGALRADWGTDRRAGKGDILCDICNLLCPRRERGNDGCGGVSFNLVGRVAGMTKRSVKGLCCSFHA